MITLTDGRYSKGLPWEVECPDENSFLFRLHNHLFPLSKSKNTPDNGLYQEVRESFDYFISELELKSSVLVPSDEQITNWQFLNLLTTGWKLFNIGLRQNSVPRDVNERLRIENVGIRALAKYDVIQTNLFKNQIHFSIYGADSSALGKSLREILIENGRLSLK